MVRITHESLAPGLGVRVWLHQLSMEGVVESQAIYMSLHIYLSTPEHMNNKQCTSSANSNPICGSHAPIPTWLWQHGHRAQYSWFGIFMLKLSSHYFCPSFTQCFSAWEPLIADVIYKTSNKDPRCSFLIFPTRSHMTMRCEGSHKLWCLYFSSRQGLAIILCSKTAY